MRDNGAQRAVLSTLDTDAESLLAKVRASESIVGVNLAETVSRSEKATFGIDDLPKTQAFALSAPAPAKYKVVAYDCGAKLSIFQNLVRVGCELTAVPWDTPAEDVLAMNPTACSSLTAPAILMRFRARIPRSRSCSARFPSLASALGTR